MRGELPAAMNFWHYTARLSAAGMQELITMPQILAGLGIEDALPLVGWVFRERWAKDNAAAIEGFLRASDAAKALITIIGGMGAVSGPLIGAVLIIPIEEITNMLFSSTAAGLSQLVFGAVLIAVVIWQPRGLLALFRRLGGRK